VVSVITATYNRADTLQRTIDSVLAQTTDDWELIIVDDGSSDATAEVLSHQDDPRIRIIVLPENQGVCAAKNVGLDSIRGDWFTFLDSDDEIVPDALETMLDYAQRTGATAISCNCIDSVTGEMTGLGPTQDGWLSAAETARCSGEHWGLTRTELLGNKRFDPRLPGIYPNVWTGINAVARRYYVHRALRIYHTEGQDRVTHSINRRALAKKVETYCILAEDAEYLRLLREVDPNRHRFIVRRIRVARLVHPFLRLIQPTRPRGSRGGTG